MKASRKLDECGYLSPEYQNKDIYQILDELKKDLERKESEPITGVPMDIPMTVPMETPIEPDEKKINTQSIDALASMVEREPDLLQNWIKDGTLDGETVATLQKTMKRNKFERKEKEVKEVHKNAITQPKPDAKDKRWRTKYGKERKSIAKPTYEQLIEALYALYFPDKVDKKDPTNLKQLYNEWLPYKKEVDDAEDTYIMRIQSSWRNTYEGTDIAKLPLSAINNKNYLQSWAYKIINEKKLTKKEYGNRVVIIRQALDYAKEMGYIEKNYFRDIKIKSHKFYAPRYKPSEEQVFTDDEKRALRGLAMDSFNSTRYKKYPLAPLAIIFQMYTGVRVGELVALKFEDIIINANDIYVHRMKQQYKEDPIERTKTSQGNRNVHLTPDAIEVINLAKKHQEENGSLCEFIFSTTDKPIPASSVQTMYHRFCEKLNIVHRNTHNMRKTYGTKSIKAVGVYETQHQMGHKDQRTTLNSYNYDLNDKIVTNELLDEALAF